MFTCAHSALLVAHDALPLQPVCYYSVFCGSGIR